MNAPLPINVGREPESNALFGADCRNDDQGGTEPHRDAEAQRLILDLGDALDKRGQTLAVGETSVGGELAGMIHATGEHEQWFRGGIVVYAGGAVPVATKLQGVARRHGVVSEQYVRALAQCVKRAFRCDWALAESGIAGPQSGRRSAKPVGMVCLAVAGPPGKGDRALAEEGAASHAAGVQGERVEQWSIALELADLGRSENRRRFCLEALRFLREVMDSRDEES